MNEHARSKNIHILLVIGNAQIRRVLKAALRSLGYVHIHAAENGAEALQWLEAGDPADLVITGLRMSRLDGFELLDKLRSNPKTENLPVILIAGRATQQLVAQAIETDADDYLLLPCSPADLDQRIQQLMERRINPSLYHQLLISGKATLEKAPSESLMWFREAVQENPDNPIGYYWLGCALERLGSREEAEKAYRKATELNPLHVKAMERLREIYRMQRRRRDLFLILRGLHRVRPDRLDIKMELGPLALEMGDTETGLSCFEAVVGLCRDRPGDLMEALARFSRFEALQENIARIAQGLFMRVLEKDPEAAVSVAKILVMCGQGPRVRDGLIKLLRRSRELGNPLAVKIHLLLAQIYEEAGIARLAREHRETAKLLEE
ncbi:TPR repeat-containing protein [Desulfacinum hydrothermale DSM 13146]|uniref:TPR repeat-containing protein n=1 Tax=Desulfacinum hydrothermale DSM 13146 TaxID=1121390 RepID=A0A1W1X2Q2_9BACT|nr:response regulator [Desulfacinum hydrothermale]SMC18236.1 TPR repeat-containing protein [Desulfacinum hydrothermale DSM 13146]